MDLDPVIGDTSGRAAKWMTAQVSGNKPFVTVMFDVVLLPRGAERLERVRDRLAGPAVPGTRLPEDVVDRVGIVMVFVSVMAIPVGIIEAMPRGWIVSRTEW